MKHPEHRESIFHEEAEILAHEIHPAGQYVLRLRAPYCAARAEPGQFAHLRCDPLLPMRRPISIQRAEEDRIELLYKVVGEGTRLLSRRRIGETLDLLGPIGQPFRPDPVRTRRLLIGGGVGMPPMIFLAEKLRGNAGETFVILGSEIPFPFTPKPSALLVPGLPDSVLGAMPLLEDWGIPSRLASQQGFAGCHQGYVTDLARAWLSHQGEEQLAETELFACGPRAMLEATARLAHEFGLPAQLSLEEYMACGVGGCAGCAVQIQTPDGPAMKRVCVDGPVFPAEAVFPEIVG